MISKESKIKDQGKHFALLLAIIVAAFSLLPTLYGMLESARYGNFFVGYPYATDDHMVYASWMRQAQDFHFFFDNRFAIDPQPGLTVHLYFFVLGLISKLLGIVWTTALAKAFFSGLFVVLCQRLIRKFTDDLYTIKLTLGLVVLGGGIGFLVWHKFGEVVEKYKYSNIEAQLLQRLPTDNWQPEGFVFPSMITNGLFMVSLCLIVGIILAILEAKESWKPVLWGAACTFVLTNIHTYDVLLLLLVSVGFLIVSATQRKITGVWLLRGAAVFAGGIPTGIWVYWVLQKDPVFQARAATLTYSPNFRQVFFGYAFLLLLAGIGFFYHKRTDGEGFPFRKILGGLGVVGILFQLYVTAPSHLEGYFMTPQTFAIYAVAMVICSCMLASENDAMNFVLTWALVGLVAIYFPALFQRKLAMGLSIPWAILAAWTLSSFLKNTNASLRTLLTVVPVGLASASSVFWLERELAFIHDGVSRTTVHPLFLSPTLHQMLVELNDRGSEKRTVIAIPGIAEYKYDGMNSDDINEYLPAFVPDMNPIVSGFTGAYSYAGHWSETPNYGERRMRSTKFFMQRTTPEFRKSIYDEIDPKSSIYAIGPVHSQFGFKSQTAFVDPETLGEVIVKGPDYVLVKNPIEHGCVSWSSGINRLFTTFALHCYMLPPNA